MVGISSSFLKWRRFSRLIFRARPDQERGDCTGTADPQRLDGRVSLPGGADGARHGVLLIAGLGLWQRLSRALGNTEGPRLQTFLPVHRRHLNDRPARDLAVYAGIGKPSAIDRFAKRVGSGPVRDQRHLFRTQSCCQILAYYSDKRMLFFGWGVVHLNHERDAQRASGKQLLWKNRLHKDQHLCQALDFVDSLLPKTGGADMYALQAWEEALHSSYPGCGWSCAGGRWIRPTNQ